MQVWLQEHQRQLSRQILTNKLPHAFVISGVQSSGYDSLASWLISSLVCQSMKTNENNIVNPCEQCKACYLAQNQNYPDHIALIPEKVHLGVDEIRRLSEFFQKTAQLGQFKTAIIHQADSMTIAASNALLKTLEEPTDNSVIILLTERIDALLPTVISRCQQIQINPSVGQDLQDELSKNTNVLQADKFANVSHFSELSNDEIATQFAIFKDHVINFIVYQKGRNNVLASLVSNKNHGLRWLEKIVTDMMRSSYGWLDENNYRVKNEYLWSVFQLINECNMKLKTLVQVNRDMLLEKLLFDIQNSKER